MFMVENALLGKIVKAISRDVFGEGSCCEFTMEYWPHYIQTASKATRIGWTDAKYASGTGRLDLLRWLLTNRVNPDLAVRWLYARRCIGVDTEGEITWCLKKFAAGKITRQVYRVKSRKLEKCEAYSKQIREEALCVAANW